MSDLIEQCYAKSAALLAANANAYGLMAASPGPKARDRRYINIFGRDACISALGMIATGDRRLAAIVKRGLATLAKYQTKRGQIPSSVNPARKETLFYFMGDKDSTLWWLLAMDFLRRYGNDRAFVKRYGNKVKRALEWLFYQDQNDCGLIEQCEAADWKDLMADNGSVLYTNVLWCEVLKRYGYGKERKDALMALNSLFLPHKASLASGFAARSAHHAELLKLLKDSTKPVPYYLDYVSSFYASDRFDTFANLLAIVLGVADGRQAQKILREVEKRRLHYPYPVRTLYPVIRRGDPDWRDYMEHRRLNLPDQYHNGGAWPFIGSFWVMALHKSGRKQAAREALERVAEANHVNNWQFNEWFHGRTGRPMGLPGQSWNAGAFLLAYHYLRGEIKL